MGVERELGLNSKREIEEYGLAEFARKCREKVVWSANELTRGSKRLGQWMDWEQQLLHVLGHEHRVHLALPQARARAGLPLHGPPLDRVVPPLRHVDLRPRARRQLRGPHRPVALRALPAPRPAGRVARRLDDDAVDAAGERRGGRQPRGRVRAPAGRRMVGGRRWRPTRSSSSAPAAPTSSGSATRGRSTTWRPPRRSSTG